MEIFHIEGQEYVPEIYFDHQKNVLSISGASYHEYTDEFFDPVFTWLEEYLSVKDRHITLNFNMNYFNTASSKCFYDILEMMEEYEENEQGKVVVNWKYQKDDIDMEEAGLDFMESIGRIDLRLIPYD